MSTVFKLPHGGRKRLISRWNALLSSHQIDSDNYFSILDDLLTRYTEPQRVYHSLAHIDKLLELAPRLNGALEFAIWFHDAVYDPTRGDNEEQSSALAVQRLQQMGLKAALIHQVEQLILATKTHHPQNEAEQWLVEADLSILGAPEKTYTSYAKAIRLEFGWLPDEVFIPRRIKVLESFLARPKLFSLKQFDSLEIKARDNLQDEIRHLKESLLASVKR